MIFHICQHAKNIKKMHAPKTTTSQKKTKTTTKENARRAHISDPAKTAAQAQVKQIDGPGTPGTVTSSTRAALSQNSTRTEHGLSQNGHDILNIYIYIYSWGYHKNSQWDTCWVYTYSCRQANNTCWVSNNTCWVSVYL